jgi:hypothetical protein
MFTILHTHALLTHRHAPTTFSTSTSYNRLNKAIQIASYIDLSSPYPYIFLRAVRRYRLHVLKYYLNASVHKMQLLLHISLDASPHILDATLDNKTHFLLYYLGGKHGRNCCTLE